MSNFEILENINLLKKYDVHAFDYIEYPHKSFWGSNIQDEDVYEALRKCCLDQENVMLYIHIPFCEQLCMFCICHRQITSNYKVAVDYLSNSLFKEIELFNQISKKIGKKFNIKEVYFGGGSPTFLKEKEFLLLKDNLKKIVDFDEINQFSVEIDPRRVDEKRLLFYAENGVNKISFGIQDFDEQVQKNINRMQPSSIIKNLLTNTVRERFKSINFDLLIGLPGQTKESISKTIDTTLELRPDRIALAYLAYNPDYHPHQRHMMMKELLPDFYRRKEIFVYALEKLTNSNYVRTGFEHFAVPEDDVTKSLNKRRAYYNSFGATTGLCTDILALGRSSYSTIGSVYYQNHYSQSEYQSKIEQGNIPIERGWSLNKDDIIRREVIKQIRTYFDINFLDIFQKFGVEKEYFKREFEVLKEFEQDKLLNIDNSYNLKLTEKGKHFSNLVSSVFDTYIKTPRCNYEIKV